MFGCSLLVVACWLLGVGYWFLLLVVVVFGVCCSSACCCCWVLPFACWVFVVGCRLLVVARCLPLLVLLSIALSFAFFC